MLSAVKTERHHWLVAGAVSAVTVFAVRLWISRGRQEYALWPDEPAQLAIARFVGGGTRWNMHNHSIWRPLFATLLAPVYWFTDDPTTVFHAALLLNAVLGGVAAWLLVLLARRLTRMDARWCAATSLIVSIWPAVLLTTDFVFSESLVIALYLATLLFLLRLHESPNLRDGLAAGLFAAAAFGTHSRMLPLTVVVIGLVVLAAARRRMAWFDAAATVAVAVAGVFSMSVYTSYLVDRLWNEPSTRNSIGGVIEQLTNGPTVLMALVGQSWTLLVASLGVVAYGAVALGRAALGRADGRGPSSGDARVVLIVFGSLAALSVVFMSDRWRSDQLVYGRYNTAVVAPLLIVGMAVLVGSIRVRRLDVAIVGAAATMTVCGGLLWWFRRDVLRESNGLEPMILGLQPFITSATIIDVPRISVLAVAGALVLGTAAVVGSDTRRRRILVVSTLVVLVVIGAHRTRDHIDRLWDDSGDASAVETLRDHELGDGVPVDYFLRAGSNSTVSMMLYQFYLPATPLTVVADPLDGPPASYVFAPIDNDALLASDARLVWRDQRRPIGLWRR